MELKKVINKLVPRRKDAVRRVGIIGGGFTGTMAAVHLIQRSGQPLEIYLFNERGVLNKGIAYAPYTQKHLLNVMASRMSAFGTKPHHFLDRVMQRPAFRAKDRSLIADAFLPRALYGEYLTEVWKEALELAATKKVVVHVLEDIVLELDVVEAGIVLKTGRSGEIAVDKCVIATGNHLPRDPKVRNASFYPSDRYFRDPWGLASVANVPGNAPVLIIGNGLTMVDTVLGLLDQGYKGEIYSLSPNGFNILPHRHSNFKYTRLTDELPLKYTLRDLVRLVNKHVKAVRDYGISAEPVIDSLRPHTQRIWQRLTSEERALFMSRLRHLWGVARHRIPLNTYDKLQHLRIEGTLKVIPGRIIDFTEHSDHVAVEYLDRKEGVNKHLKVSRIINCTGPETNFMHQENSLLKSCLIKGILTQDVLKLGVMADTGTYQVLKPDGEPHPDLFTIGSNLKGELWESTAISELRDQAEKLSGGLLASMKETVD